jgi:cellulose synthase/poly-beta-1,6-N-acetylglucosamine synthase-like glycosyltransferase
MVTLQVAFWLALLVGLYPYFLYPILVLLLGRVLQRPIRLRDDFVPNVTVIIAAFNEAKFIEATVRNKLEQIYPVSKLDVIVVSDSSEDGTDDIVAKIAHETARVRLMRQVPRQGKTAGLNLAMEHARGEVIVFSDANSIYRPDTVQTLVRNFADERVGYVTGRMLYVNPDGSLVGDGCSAFMRYENALRAAETRIGSVVGVDGGVDAVRRTLYQPMRSDQLPDFVLPLRVIAQKHRVVFEPAAVLTEDTLTQTASEYRMRVRVALRAFWALWDNAELFAPSQGLFAWQLLSHKLLRYLSFLPLAIALVLAWILAPHSAIYKIIAWGEVLFLGMVVIAYGGPKWLSDRTLPRFCSYFFLLNVASAVAFFRFMRGQKQVLWQPRVG